MFKSAIIHREALEYLVDVQELLSTTLPFSFSSSLPQPRNLKFGSFAINLPLSSDHFHYRGCQLLEQAIQVGRGLSVQIFLDLTQSY